MDYAGPLLLIAVIAGVGLGFGISFRNHPFRLFTAIFFSLVMTALTATAVITTALLVDHINAQLSHPKYEAVIIDYESYWSEDDDGDRTLMHRPTLQFTDNTGQVITRPSQTSSSGTPTIGDTRSVRYLDGKMHEPSFLLYALLALFAMVSGYFVAVATAHMLGRSTDGLAKVGVMALFYGIVPLAMAGMGLGMLWAFYDYGFGSNDANLSAGPATFIAMFGLLIVFFLAAYIRIVLTAPGREQK